MAYAIHMEREPEIKLEEWIEAVNSTEGCRINNEGVSAINPNTGEEIHISGNEGDVEVLFQTKCFLGFGKKNSWEMCITFFEGRASFKATEDIESTENPVRVVISKLARKLSAKVVGDEGEVYEW